MKQKNYQIGEKAKKKKKNRTCGSQKKITSYASIVYLTQKIEKEKYVSGKCVRNFKSENRWKQYFSKDNIELCYTVK